MPSGLGITFTRKKLGNPSWCYDRHRLSQAVCEAQTHLKLLCTLQHLQRALFSTVTPVMSQPCILTCACTKPCAPGTARAVPQDRAQLSAAFGWFPIEWFAGAGEEPVAPAWPQVFCTGCGPSTNLLGSVWGAVAQGARSVIIALPWLQAEQGTSGQVSRSQSFILHPASFILHHSSRILHPASFIPHPSPRILHPAPLTSHPSSRILHLASFIPHPSAPILHPLTCFPLGKRFWISPWSPCSISIPQPHTSSAAQCSLQPRGGKETLPKHCRGRKPPPDMPKHAADTCPGHWGT